MAVSLVVSAATALLVQPGAVNVCPALPGGIGFPLFAGANISFTPTSGNLTRLQLRFAEGFRAGDALFLDNSALAALPIAFNVSFAALPPPATLDISGNAAFDVYISALRSVRYQNVLMGDGDADSTGTRRLEFWGSVLPGGGTLLNLAASSNFSFVYVPAPVGTTRLSVVNSITNNTYILGCPSERWLDPGISVCDNAFYDQQDARVTSCNVTFVAGIVAGEDFLAVDRDPNVTCLAPGPQCPCPGLSAITRVDGSLTVTGDSSSAAYERCLRRVYYTNVRAASGTPGLRTVQFSCLARGGSAVAAGQLYNITVRTRTFEGTCPPWPGDLGPSQAQITTGSPTTVYETGCGCANGTTALAPLLNVSDAGFSDQNAALLSLVRVYFEQSTLYRNQDRLGVLSLPGGNAFAPCPGLDVVTTETPDFGIRMSGAASASLYQACLRNVFYFNTAPANSQVEGTRLVRFYVETPQYGGRVTSALGSASVVVRAPISACANGCPVNLPPASIGPWNILLLACEQVKYHASELVVAGPSGVCLCATSRSAPCFRPQITAPSNDATVASARICFTTGFVASQDVLVYQCTFAGVSWIYSALEGCGYLSGPVLPAVMEAALRCVKYVNTALVPVVARRVSASGVHEYNSGPMIASRPMVSATTGSESSHGVKVAIDAAGAAKAAGDASVPVAGSVATDDPALFMLHTRRLHSGTGFVRGIRRLTITIFGSGFGVASTSQPVVWLVPDSPVPVVLPSTRKLSFSSGAQLPGGIVVDPAIVFTDPDCTSLEGVQLRFLTSTYVPGEDILKCPPGLDPGSVPISCVFNAVEGILHMWGPAPISALAHWARKVRYCNTRGGMPTRGRRILYWLAYDAETVDPSNGETATVFIDVGGASGRGCPTLRSGELQHIIYGSDTPLPIESFVGIIPDPPTEPLVRATVRITSGYVPGEDSLTAMSIAPGITVTFDAATATLTMAGLGTPHAYQWMLRGVLYTNARGNAATPGRRDIGFLAFDTDCSSNLVLSSVTVLAATPASPVCPCTPRLAQSTSATAYLDVSITPSVPLGFTDASIAYLGPLDLIASNCSRTLLNTNGVNIRYAFISFVRTTSSIYEPSEDRIAFAAPALFPVAMVGSLDAGDLRLTAVFGVRPLTDFIQALGFLAYRNILFGAATLGVRQVVVSFYTPEGCYMSSVYSRVDVYRGSGAQHIPVSVDSQGWYLPTPTTSPIPSATSTGTATATAGGATASASTAGSASPAAASSFPGVGSPAPGGAASGGPGGGGVPIGGGAANASRTASPSGAAYADLHPTWSLPVMYPGNGTGNDSDASSGIAAPRLAAVPVVLALAAVVMLGFLGR